MQGCPAAMNTTRLKLIFIGQSARLAAAGILVAVWIIRRILDHEPQPAWFLLWAAAYSVAAWWWTKPVIDRWPRHFTVILLAHFAVDLAFVFYIVYQLAAPWHYHVYAVCSITVVFAGLVDKPSTAVWMAAEAYIIYLLAMAVMPEYTLGTPLVTAFEATFVGGYLALIGAVSYYAKRTLDIHQQEADSSSSALEHANLQLRQRMIDLSRSDRYKSEFLHMVSHELRTPLNSIIGFSDLMLKGLEGPVSPAQREDLESIHRSGRYLLNIVNDILDMAKIQSGDLRLKPERCDVIQLARESAEALLPAYTSKGLSLEISGPEGDETLAIVEADPARVRQVFFNLLSNAVKFTDHGGIRVSLSRENGSLVCAVSDTGRGIPSDRLEEVFDPFKQVDPALNRKHSGTGLGLPIAKRLVELHGGTIRVRSQVGRGTTFEFSLPRALN